MECYVIFVMAWYWCNATEIKPQNVTSKLKKTVDKDDKRKIYRKF